MLHEHCVEYSVATTNTWRKRPYTRSTSRGVVGLTRCTSLGEVTRSRIRQRETGPSAHFRRIRSNAVPAIRHRHDEEVKGHHEYVRQLHRLWHNFPSPTQEATSTRRRPSHGGHRGDHSPLDTNEKSTLALTVETYDKEKTLWPTLNFLAPPFSTRSDRNASYILLRTAMNAAERLTRRRWRVAGTVYYKLRCAECSWLSYEARDQNTIYAECISIISNCVCWHTSSAYLIKNGGGLVNW